MWSRLSLRGCLALLACLFGLAPLVFLPAGVGGLLGWPLLVDPLLGLVAAFLVDRFFAFFVLLVAHPASFSMVGYLLDRAHVSKPAVGLEDDPVPVDRNEVEAAHMTRPRLGRILVDSGLLSEEQLEDALEDQTRTGRRLGEIVVERGYMSGPALANALATQHGGVVRTEYGIATGLGTTASTPRQVGPNAGLPATSDASPAGTDAPPEAGTPPYTDASAEPDSDAPDASAPAPQSLSLLHVLEDWSGLIEDLKAKVTLLETEI